MTKLVEFWGKSVLVFYLGVGCCSLVSASRDFNVKSIVLKLDPNYSTNFSANIVNGFLNIDVILLKTITAGVRVNIDFQMPLKNLIKYRSLFRYDVEYCNVVKAMQNNLFRKWAKDVLKYTNIDDTCPIQPGYYYLKNWCVDPKLIPSFLSEGKYRIKLHVYYDQFNSEKGDFVVQIVLVGIVT